MTRYAARASLGSLLVGELLARVRGVDLPELAQGEPAEQQDLAEPEADGLLLGGGDA